MNKILGIDTGGTYTDTVVICADTKEILYKSKTLTTKRDLKRCIEDSFVRIPAELLADVSMVCLSTTLATNAIVEGHGCKEGLILIGERPRGKMPSSRVALVQGRFDIKGRQRQNLDPKEVDAAVESFRGQVDAIAVSGYASVRNPTHELYVKKVIERKLDIPVVCAHELTSTLGFYDRTVTADLNAKLIPMVCNLMDSVKTAMRQYQVDAPLMIVKGDGSLMTDVCARSKPIETILSGPAASVIGGMHLSGLDDAFVLDMGGTTTDIANVSGGKLNIRGEGARVGGWLTHVQAAEVFTIGLGGDSRIFFDGCGKLQIGPQKSIPFCMAGAQYPDLIREVGDILVSKAYRHFRYQDEEAYMLIRKYDTMTYSDDEKVIVEVLRYYPHTLHYLEQNLHVCNLNAVIENLVRLGVLGRISLTPTDIMHATGRYTEWNTVIAELGVRIAAARAGQEQEEFLAEIERRMAEKLDCACIQAAMYFDRQECELREDSAAEYFLNRLFFRNDSSTLQASYRLKKRVVAIGAPAAAWASQAGKTLRTETIIPEHAEVANAVGAAVGRPVETIEILIRPDSVSGRYLVYSPLNRMSCETLEEATEYALTVGEKCVQRMSEQREYSLQTDQEDMCIEDVSNGKQIFVERMVTLRAHFHN